MPVLIALLLAALVLGAMGPGLPSAEAASTDSARRGTSFVRDCGVGNSTSTLVDGVNFTFGGDVTEEMQRLVKDAMNYTREYAERTLDVRLAAFDICSYGTADELGESEAKWLDVPGILNQRVTIWRSTNTAGVARFSSTTTASGRTTSLAFFTYTARPVWQQNSPSAILLVAHEYFHLIQAQLVEGVPLRDWGPIWLTEGIAEVVGLLVFSEKQAVAFDRIADRIRQQSGPYKGNLGELEAQSVFGSASNVQEAYPIAFLAADSLRKSKGMKAFLDYYTAIGAGTPWKDAFIHSFGLSVDLFYEQFAP